MKKVTFLFVIAGVMSLTIASAQNTWTQKTDFGESGKTAAVGFSIGNKGYIGTGRSDNGPFTKDFWEYDPATDSWTQKADFGGSPRINASGFSIGSKGYIGTGDATDGFTKSDLWEYDTSTNVWIQKSDMIYPPTNSAVGFAIGNKGYIGTGENAPIGFQEYDPATDTWTQKADFAGEGRFGAVGFSLGNKGYIGTGYGSNYLKDFWEYDPATNAWTQKANFGGSARWIAIGFSIGDKGYIGTGTGHNGRLTDFWEYNPATNSWRRKADFEGGTRYWASGFSIGSKGYITQGDSTNLAPSYTDLWEYTPDTLTICNVPIGESTVNITDSSAKLKWSAVPGAQGYKVRYKVENTSEWQMKTTYGISKPISGLLANTTYKWEVRTMCQIAPEIMSDWSYKQEFTTLPYRLGEEPSSQLSFQLYPNPAEDQATIQFMLAQSSHITINVFDASGKEIAVLLNDDLDEGEHSLSINTLHFPKQVYLVKLISDFGIENQKLIVQ